MDVLQAIKSTTFVQSDSKPAIFTQVDGLVTLIVHVNEILMFGPIDQIKEIFTELQGRVVIRVDERPGDELMYLGRRIKLTATSYIMSGSKKLVEILIKDLSS